MGSLSYFFPGSDPRHLMTFLCEKDDRQLGKGRVCLEKGLENFWVKDFSGRSGQKQWCFEVCLGECGTKGR